MDKPVKQVLVIRKDLKMRRGKEISQGAHAAMMFLVKRLQKCEAEDMHFDINQNLTLPEYSWVKTNFRKVTLQVDSEAELLEILSRAKEAGLEAQVVQDAGLTEFDGEPTFTAVAIGPDYDEKIDPITKHLKLY